MLLGVLHEFWRNSGTCVNLLGVFISVCKHFLMHGCGPPKNHLSFYEFTHVHMWWLNLQEHNYPAREQTGGCDTLMQTYIYVHCCRQKNFEFTVESVHCNKADYHVGFYVLFILQYVLWISSLSCGKFVSWCLTQLRKVITSVGHKQCIICFPPLQ